MEGVTSEEFKKLEQPQQLKFIESYSSKNGLEASWEFIKKTYQGTSGEIGAAHDLAHFLGELAFKKKGIDGLKICSQDFAFGCFHGLLDSAFLNGTELLGEAQGACTSLGEVSSGPFASCIHGIGHGLASFHETRGLNEALLDCDRLSDGQIYCYDGVFMEFARSAQSSFYNPGNPLYPCNKLSQKYSLSCIRNQTTVMLSRFKLGFNQVSDVCSKISDTDGKKSCFNSLGFYAVASSSGNVDTIISMCREILDLSGQAQCITAAAGELVFQNVANWQNLSRTICESLTETFRTECFSHVSQIARDYSR